MTISDSSNGFMFWFPHCKSEVPWCPPCIPCFISGCCCQRRMGVVFMGGWASHVQGCGGLPPVFVVRRPMKLLTITALNCVKFVLVSVSPLPGVVRGSVAPLKVLQETFITCIHFMENEHMYKHDSDLI